MGPVKPVEVTTGALGNIRMFQESEHSNGKPQLIFSMRFLLLLFLLIGTRGGYINAIGDDYPFKIDFILLEIDYKFLDAPSSNLSTDVGTHQIAFVQQHSVTPHSVLLIATKNYQSPSFQGSNLSNSMQFYFVAQNLTQTGFMLKSSISKSIFIHLLLGYMTVVNGYGIQVTRIDLASFTITTAALKVYSSSYLTSLPINAANTSDYVLAVFTNALYLASFATYDTTYLAQSNLVGSTVTVQIKVPSTSTITNLTVSVLLFQNSLFLSSTAGFSGYFFECKKYTNQIGNSDYNITNTTNATTGVYFMGGLVSGRIGRGWTVATTLLVDRPDPKIFNTVYIRERNNSLNYILGNLMDNHSPYLSVVVTFWMYRTSCGGTSHPYLMMNSQKCYDVCPAGYYNDSSNRCNLCTNCTNILDCDYCYYSMCNADQYYIPSNKSCKKCITIDSHCTFCLKAKCTTCLFPYKVNSTDYKCTTCQFPYKFQNNSCYHCQYPYKLTADNKCESCLYPYEFSAISQICVIKLVSFQFVVYPPIGTQNIIAAFVFLEDNLTQVTQRYNSEWSISGTLTGPTLTYFFDNHTIKAAIPIASSLTSPTIKVKFIHVIDDIVLLKTEDQQTIQNVYYADQLQTQVYGAISSVMDQASDSSGYILSTLSSSSLSKYAVGILWNFQIASFYLFLPVQKPRSLLMFLNTTMEMQDVQILPFSIPNPFADSDVQVEGEEIYDQYEIDLYFLRSNCQCIVSLVVFTVFYLILFLLFRKTKPTSFIMKLIRLKLVDQVYVNVSMNFYSVITVMAFTASVSLTSKAFIVDTLWLNYLSAAIGLFLMFLFSIIHPVILFLYKEQQTWDSQDCYIGLNREKKHSELALGLFLISQLIIPVSIPLFHPLFSIGAIISTTLLNIILLFKIRTVKFYICIYYRVVSQLSFTLFNLMFLVYYAVQVYFPDFPVEILEVFGYVSVCSMVLVIVLELVQLVTQLTYDSIRLIRRLCMKSTLKELTNDVYDDSMLTTKPNIGFSEYSKRKQKRIQRRVNKANKRRWECEGRMISYHRNLEQTTQQQLKAKQNSDTSQMLANSRIEEPMRASSKQSNKIQMTSMQEQCGTNESGVKFNTKSGVWQSLGYEDKSGFTAKDIRSNHGGGRSRYGMRSHPLKTQKWLDNKRG